MKPFIRHLLLALLVAQGLAGCHLPKAPPAASKPQYVRVEQVDGKYWFVRGGERFLERGVNVVQPADHDKGDGRFYNALAKYGGDKSVWAKDAEARLRSWNFNTVGGWSDEVLYTNTTLYHTRVLWLGPWGNHDGRLIDVFSGDYAEAVDAEARLKVVPHASNERLIGWFLNNELPWHGETGWFTSPTVSLLSRYMHLPPAAPGKVRLLGFLKETYSGDFAAFRANWEVSAQSFDELPGLRTIRPVRRESRRDVIAWSGIVAEQYFRLCTETVRRYDPNHLILGVRFAERAQEPVLAACGKYCDVVSLNHYQKTGRFDATKIGAIAALTKKPVMVTEYSFRAMENSSGCPNTKGADVTVDTQQDRADHFRLYMTNALAQPFIIGCDWFMYHDQPPAGRFDGEDSNYGLVDIRDQFYTTLLGAITEVNGRADQIHQFSDTPVPPYDPAVLADYREVEVRSAGAPPARPVIAANASSRCELWGNFPGAKIENEVSSNGTVAIRAAPGPGWGCGATFYPPQGTPTNTDGSVHALGATQLVAVITARAGVRFYWGVDESGRGAPDSPDFKGAGHADGEVYNPTDIATKEGRQEYTFPLREMDVSPSWGNQRGNNTVDTDGIATVHVFFPGKQSPFVMEIESVRFE